VIEARACARLAPRAAHGLRRASEGRAFGRSLRMARRLEWRRAMTTQTSSSTSFPVRAASAPRKKQAPQAAIAAIPDPHDMTGAWILTIVTAVMAITIGVALYLAKQIQL